MLGMTIYGNTEQTKTDGKNLVYNLISKTAFNGLNHVVRQDGAITTSGTPNNTYSYITEPTPDLIIKKGETVTLSVNKPLPFDLFIGGSEDGVYSNLGIQLPAGQLQITGQVQTTKSVNCLIAGRMTAGQAIAPITYKAQLEYGNTATEFSYYTGGFNNLFDEFSGLPINSPNGVVLSNQDGVLKLTGKPTINWLPILIRNNLPLLDKTTYTVVSYNGARLQFFAQVLAYKKDGSGADTFGGPSGKIFTFTTDSTKYDRYSMKLQLGNLGSYPEPVTLYNNFALLQGNYNENNLPEYSPYNTGLASPRPQYPQVIKELTGGKVIVRGKNLLRLSTISPSNGLSSTVTNDGIVAYSGQMTNSWADITSYTIFSAPLPAGTYTFSIDHPRTHRITFKYKLADNTFNQIIANMTATSTSNTFTTTQPIIAGYLYIAAANGSSLNDIVKPQLEYGDTATDFVPHESTGFTLPSNLNIYKLTDDIYDEVKLENGVAKLIKRVGKLELSGEDNITLYRTRADGSLGFQWRSPSGEFLFTQQQELATIISSHFSILREPTEIGNNDFSSGIGLFKTGDSPYPRYTTNITIWLSLTDMQSLKITDLASFKNWLKSEKTKGTPVTVYYEMKTPTEEEITNPTLLAELKKLMEMRTYQDVTNISITGTDLTPDIKVKYMRKIGE